MGTTATFPANDVVLAHPVAELFPLLSDADLRELAADIREHGLRDPIIRDAAGRILDGRNRLRACKLAGVTPRFELWSENAGDPIALIISRNLHRRHLDISQRALIATKLATLTNGQRADLKLGKFAKLEPLTQDGAAQLLNVGKRSVVDARVVLAHGNPNLIRAVEQGDVAVSTAANAIRAGQNPLAIHFSSESPEHYTPASILSAVQEVFGTIPDLDPCSNSGPCPNVKARTHFTEAENGLEQPWHGRVFLNPPYGRVIGEWTRKIRQEWQLGKVKELIALLPARTDTEWFNDLSRDTDDVVFCFLFGRLTFVGNTDPAPFPSLVAYFGPKHDLFAHVFASLGGLWMRPPLDFFVDHR